MDCSAEDLSRMNAMFPLKKRRGRPPKFLNVWRQQFLSNMRVASPAAAGHALNGGTDLMRFPGTPTPSVTLQTDPVEPLHKSAPVTLTLAPDYAGNTPTLSSRPDGGSSVSPGSISSPSANFITTSPIPHSTGVVITGGNDLPPAPIKRRPGRPPGSTKKSKMANEMPYMSDKEAPGDFSLRRFFEAGGRDYNDYLDWFKRMKTASGSPPQPTANATRMFQPYFPVSVPGGGMMVPQVGPLGGFPVTQQGIPCRYPFRPQFPVPVPPNAVVNMTTSMYTNSAPLLTPSPTVSTAQTAADHMDVYQNQALTLGDNTTNSANEEYPRDRLTQENQVIDDSCVLDLSFNRKRLNSDSEKENDGIVEEINHKKFRYNRDFNFDRHKTGVSSVKEESSKPEVDSTKSDISNWSVNEVAQFVSELPECASYAAVFRSHRIDGASLPHLSDEHLLGHVGMKLGHMIRLRLAIDRLREPAKQ